VLAHIKNGKSSTETAQPLRVTPRAVTKSLKWFIDEDVDRLESKPHYWSTQRLPKGTRPQIVRQQQSESANLLGAVCAQRDAPVGVVLPYANTKTMALHLQEINRVVPPAGTRC
jgi:hypothetical protein